MLGQFSAQPTNAAARGYDVEGSRSTLEPVTLSMIKPSSLIVTGARSGQSADGKGWVTDTISDWWNGEEEETQPVANGDTVPAPQPSPSPQPLPAPAAECPNPWIYAAIGAAGGLLLGYMAGQKKKGRR